MKKKKKARPDGTIWEDNEKEASEKKEGLLTFPW